MESWGPVAGSERRTLVIVYWKGARPERCFHATFAWVSEYWGNIRTLLFFFRKWERGGGGREVGGRNVLSMLSLRLESLKKAQTFTAVARWKVTGSRVCCISGWRVTDIPLDTVAWILTCPGGEVKHTAQRLLGVQRLGVFRLALRYIPET